MNKRIVIVISLVIIVIGGALTYVLLTPKDKDGSAQTTATQSTVTTVDDNVEQSPQKGEDVSRTGEYKDYSADLVKATPGTKLLFFHAPWCPQCRELEATINENGVPAGVTVFKIDYDTNQALRQQYGVTLQTTFVKIDDSGNKVKSYVAYEEPQFASVERELLP